MFILPPKVVAQRAEGGAFAGLRPLSPEAVASVARRYPGISAAYLAFIAEIGVGACDAMRLYEPVPLEEAVEGHSSYRLYQGSALRRLFGRRGSAKLPRGALAFCDTGASWRYCFGPRLGDDVHVFDMATGALEAEGVTFLTFLDDLLT